MTWDSVDALLCKMHTVGICAGVYPGICLLSMVYAGSLHQLVYGCSLCGGGDGKCGGDG